MCHERGDCPRTPDATGDVGCCLGFVQLVSPNLSGSNLSVRQRRINLWQNCFSILNLNQIFPSLLALLCPDWTKKYFHMKIFYQQKNLNKTFKTAKVIFYYFSPAISNAPFSKAINRERRLKYSFTSLTFLILNSPSGSSNRTTFPSSISLRKIDIVSLTNR